jgi:regulatory protein YycH of two-component signal transduction system YycFG
MVEFETIKSEELKFGNSSFIEVARKKAITEKGENEFISVSRGFYMLDNQKRYNKSFTIPVSKEVVDFVSEKIKEML